MVMRAIMGQVVHANVYASLLFRNWHVDIIMCREGYVVLTGL